MTSSNQGSQDTAFPSTWEMIPFSQLISDFRGGAPLRPSDFKSDGVKVLPKGGVGRSGWLEIDEVDQQYCSPEYAQEHSSSCVDQSFTIVVLRDLVPSGPSIGQIVRIRQPEKYVLAQGVYGFKLSHRADPRYLCQLSNSRWYRRTVNSIMVGSTQVHITNTAFKALKIPVPTLAEQRKIAEALSDADLLIEELERLIAKKRAIKQGAMQELLSGRRRLPGFSEEWSQHSLGAVAHIKTGSRNNQDKDDDGAYPFFVRSATVERINSAAYDCEAVLVPGEGNIGSIFHYVSGKFDAHQRVYVISQFAETVVGYFVFLQMKQNFGPHALQNTVKATVDSLRLPTFQNFTFSLPPTLEEQKAIASVLVDMEHEVKALEAQLAKASSVKQGMMQELLTGKVRLI